MRDAADHSPGRHLTNLRRAASLIAAGAIGAILVPAGATAAENIKEVLIRNPPSQPVPVAGAVSVSNTPTVHVDNLAGARPYQRVIELEVPGGSRSAEVEITGLPSGTIFVVEHAGGSHDNGWPIRQIRLVELCDTSNGQSGLGGFVALPVDPPAELQRYGGPLQWHLEASECGFVALDLVDSLPSSISVNYVVTLSGQLMDAPTHET